jgi:hypothetical protein
MTFLGAACRADRAYISGIQAAENDADATRAHDAERSAR